MKKPPVFFALPLLGALIAAVSCSMPLLPAKARIKSNAAFAFTVPQIHEENVVRYVDEAFREAIAGQEGVEIFDYTALGDLKAYLIRYKIDPFEFEIDGVSIPEPAIEPVELTNIAIPDDLGGAVDFSPGSLAVSSGGSASIPGLSPVPLGSLGIVKAAVIGGGTVRVTAYNASSALISDLDYTGLTVSLTLGGESFSLVPVPGENGTYSLSGAEIGPLTNVTISGSIANTGSGGVTLEKIVLTPQVTEFEKVQIATDASHSLTKTASIDVSGVPSGVNFVTFEEIGVDLAFRAKYAGESVSADMVIEGLPIALDAPLLGFSAGSPPYASQAAYEAAGTGCKTTGPDGLSFVRAGHTIYFDGTSPGDYLKPTDADSTASGAVTVIVNPQIDGAYAVITLHNVKAKTCTLSVEPRVNVSIEKANIDPGAFIDSSSLSGSFPGDPVNIADIFAEVDGMVSNINLDTLDLYLYLDGSGRELLTGTKISLTAQAVELPGGETLVSQTLGGGSGGPPPFPPYPAVEGFPVFSGSLNPPDLEIPMTDCINETIIRKKPSNFTIDYEIKLVEKLDVSGACLEGGTIGLSPELILVMPLRLRILTENPGDAYGSLKITSIEVEDDIFGRTGPGSKLDEYLDYLKRVSLRVDYDNFLGLGGLSFHIVNDSPAWEKSVSFAEGAGKTLFLNLTADDFKVYPLKPKLEIRVAAQPGLDYGLLEIKRGGVRATISVEAESRVDLELDL
jgi:hypothetical protein